MPQTEFNEVYDEQGNLVSRVQVQRPQRAVTATELAQVKQTIKNNMQTFFPGGTPTGTPTNAQIRNWLIAVSTGLRYLYNEMDNE